MIRTLSSSLKRERINYRFYPETPKKCHLFHSTHYQHSHKYIPKKYKISRDLFIKVTRDIFNQVTEGMLTERDGVILDDFGYFFIFMIPKPRINYTGRSFSITMGRQYYPMFRGIGRNNPLNNYHIPYSAIKLRKEVNRRVRKGQLYTFSLKMLQDKKVEQEYEKILKPRV